MSCNECPKVSHSAWQKYLTCPKIYDYHYNERLRPIYSSSALAFGVAMDAGLNTMLLNFKANNCVELAVLAFRDAFKFEELETTRFDTKDFDAVLLPDSEIGQNAEFNAWKSMRVKGRMLIEEYARVILPLIEEVYSVQDKLHNRPGFIDAIVKLRGHGRVLLDHKTSARPYDIDAVKNDTQLALYCKDKGIAKAAFVVLIKQLNKKTVRTCTSCAFDGSGVRHKTCPQDVNGKRCNGNWNERHDPEVNIQILVEDMPETTTNLVDESIRSVEAGIQAGVFPRNLKACGRIYGAKCPYYNVCWSNNKEGMKIEPKS